MSDLKTTSISREERIYEITSEYSESSNSELVKKLEKIKVGILIILISSMIKEISK